MKIEQLNFEKYPEKNIFFTFCLEIGESGYTEKKINPGVIKNKLLDLKDSGVLY